MKHTHLLFLAALTASGSAALAETPDFKGAVNASIRAIRAQQNEDGSYGPADLQPGPTARFLYALGICPEHYTIFDGPFVRRAVEALLSYQREDGRFGDGEDAPARTAEAVAALRVAAPGSHDEAVRRAAGWLESTDASRREPFLSIARGDPVEWPFTTPFLDGSARDEGGAWIDRVFQRVWQEQERALQDLTPAGVPPAVDRLLALIELYQADAKRAKPSGGGDDPALARREVPASDDERRARILEGLAFLERSQTDGRFGFGEVADPGITAIALSAVVKTADRLGIERPAYVEKGFQYLLSLQKENGGIYDMGLANYITSVAVEAMVAAGDPRFHEPIRRAVAFLQSTQLDEDEGYSAEEDAYYGGFGYGSSEKPDLSNTQMAVQALHEARLDPQAETWAKVIGFLQRCQNLPESGAPPMKTASGEEIVPGDDGGAIYRPGDSKAGTEPVGDNRRVARSYGSMTYALLKSYLFAGLDPDDERVQAAVRWIREHYTLEINPGFERVGRRNAEYQGLYYYYLTMARALDALGEDQIVDPSGRAHDWRRELRDHLFSLQAEDGHWVNRKSSRWMEGNPVLTTSYALLALAVTG